MKCGWLASLIAVSLFDANSPGCYGSLIHMVCHMLLNIVLSTRKFYWNGGMWNIIVGCWCWLLSPILLLLVKECYFMPKSTKSTYRWYAPELFQ